MLLRCYMKGTKNRIQLFDDESILEKEIISIIKVRYRRFLGMVLRVEIKFKALKTTLNFV